MDFDYGTYEEPIDRMEDLAVMLVAELLEEGRLESVCQRALRWDGNVGAEALKRMLGVETPASDLFKRFFQAQREGQITVVSPEELHMRRDSVRGT